MGIAVLDGLKYANSHEWVKHEGSVATIGITDHAQVLFFSCYFWLYSSQAEPNLLGSCRWARAWLELEKAQALGSAWLKLKHWFGSCRMSLYQLIYT